MTADGVIDLEALRVALREGKGRALVAVMAANNETGVVQPIAEVSQLVREARRAAAGGCGAGGRQDRDLDFSLCDYMALSAHKIGGPQGVGALAGARGRAAGAATGRAAGRRRAGAREPRICPASPALARRRMPLADGDGERARIAHLRDHFEAALKAAVPGCRDLRRKAPRLCNTSDFAVPGLAAETALIGAGSGRRDGQFRFGLLVRQGRAVSHVLAAMGVDEELAAAPCASASAGPPPMEDVDAAVASLLQLVARTRARPRKEAA